MPVAGSNVEVVPMQVVGNRLIEHRTQRILSSMAQDPETALEALRRGDVAYLHFYGSNVPEVRSACVLEGVEVSG